MRFSVPFCHCETSPWRFRCCHTRCATISPYRVESPTILGRGSSVSFFLYLTTINVQRQRSPPPSWLLSFCSSFACLMWFIKCDTSLIYINSSFRSMQPNLVVHMTSTLEIFEIQLTTNSAGSPSTVVPRKDSEIIRARRSDGGQGGSLFFKKIIKDEFY